VQIFHITTEMLNNSALHEVITEITDTVIAFKSVSQPVKFTITQSTKI